MTLRRGITVIVVFIAAIISYSHMVQFNMSTGDPWQAYLIPLTITGLVVSSSMVLWTQRSNSPLAWVSLLTGAAISIAANIAGAGPTLSSVLVAAAAPIAFVLGFGIYIQQSEASQATGSVPVQVPKPEDLLVLAPTNGFHPQVTPQEELARPTTTTIQPTLKTTLLPEEVPATGEAALQQTPAPESLPSEPQTAETRFDELKRPPSELVPPRLATPADQEPCLENETKDDDSQDDSVVARRKAPGKGQGIAVNKNAVIGFIQQGMTNEQIARKMGCSAVTVWRIRSKHETDVQRRKQATA